MTRGRHRVVPVRRPLAGPIVGVAVAATMLSGPLLLAAVPAGPEAPEAVATTAGPAAEGTRAEAVQFSAVTARDEASASRGLVRPATGPSVDAEPQPEPSETSEPSEAPQPPVATEEPEATVEAPPPAEPPAVVGTLWATRDVNVRAGSTADTERIGYLAAGDQVDVTGATEGGWTQVVVDGRVGWVNSSYLSQTEPRPEPEPEPEPVPDAEPAAATGASDAACSIDPGIEANLTGNARAVYRAVCASYGGSVSGFGGYRPGDRGDHGSGRAVDVMVSGAVGWEISRFLQDRAGELGITYVIYEQRIWMAGSPAGAWEWMEDRGGVTANHYDHVHVSVR